MANNRVYSMLLKGSGGASGIGTLPFWQIATPSATAIEIIRIELGQEDSTTSQQETITMVRRSTNSTFPNVSNTAQMNLGDPITALAATSITNGYGISTATGSYTASMMRWNFNVLNGLLYLPVPEERPVLSPTGFITLEFTASPAANQWSGHILYRELY